VRAIVPNLGHFLHIEAPEAIAERIATWVASGSPDPRGETNPMAVQNPKG
jgi:hypothetical protein